MVRSFKISARYSSPLSPAHHLNEKLGGASFQPKGATTKLLTDGLNLLMKFDLTQQIVVQLYNFLDLKLVGEAIPAPMPAYSPESNTLKMARIYYG